MTKQDWYEMPIEPPTWDPPTWQEALQLAPIFKETADIAHLEYPLRSEYYGDGYRMTMDRPRNGGAVVKAKIWKIDDMEAHYYRYNPKHNRMESCSKDDYAFGK